MEKDTKHLTAIQDRLIETHTQMVTRVWGEESKLYNHAVLCSVNLPYRDPGDGVRVFQRESGGAALRLEAGASPSPTGFEDVGLPFGPRARLLLLHLCSEAVKQQSPLVEVDTSFTSFARSLGLSTNGKNLKTLREQIKRMSAVTMRLSRDHGSYIDVFQGPIFSKLRAETPTDPDQLTFWTSYVEFSQEFFQSLSQNAVPLSKDAIGALKHSSRALDIYVWLAYRLWRIPPSKTVKLKWTTLRFQFGERTQDINSFKRAFNSALKQVLCVYPKAQVKVVRGGIQIASSPPPIPFKNRESLLLG
jgi:hypothetical protein